MQKLAVLVFLSLSLPSCVLKSAHNEVLASNVKLSTERDALQKEHEALGTKIEAAQKRLAEIENRNQELSNVNQMLVSKNSEYSKRSLETQQELLRAKEEKSKTEEKLQMASRTYDDLIKSLKDEISQGQVKIAELGGRITVNVADQILFPSGSDRLQTGGKTVLSKVVTVLKRATDKTIEVEGHTDNVKISGTLTQKFPSNWELSTSRATTVVRFLENQGIAPTRLKAAGYAEHHPLASNSTPEGRMKNRRIELVLVPPPLAVNP